MKNLKMFLILIAILLFPSLLFASKYVISGSSWVANQTFENFTDYDHSGYGSGGGIYYIHGGSSLYLSNVNFLNNKGISDEGTYYHGSIISNSGSVYFQTNTNISSNTVKVAETLGYGGAIHNGSSGWLEIFDDSSLTNNGVTSEKSACGGAIYNYNYVIVGKNTIFDSNFATSSNSSSWYPAGGAIFNDTDSVLTHANSGGDNIIFKNNRVINNSGRAYGGAIYNTKAENRFGSNIRFDSNEVVANVSNYTVGGGAIYNRNNSKLQADGNIIFTSNTVINNGGLAAGGAIYNEKSTITFSDGAIFLNNAVNGTSGLGGGAIYNDEGTINLSAKTNNVEFTGNTANGKSSAIYDFGGKINLRASENASIIFNDKIQGGTSSVLYINPNTNIFTPKGKIILNEDMSGWKGQVVLYNGEVELQAKTVENSNINTNKFFNGDLTFSGGTLNILNNAIDNINISNLTISKTSGTDNNLKVDVDLSNNTSDNFTITNNVSVSGTLNLTAINILGVNETSGQITLFQNTNSPILNINTSTIYDGYEYIFTNSQTAGVLNYERGAKADLKNAINKTTPIVRSYSLSEDEIVAEDLGQLGGAQLTIFGNGYDIIASSVSGITVSEGQTLNIENVKEIKNFSSENHGGFINNAGTINISDNIIFSSNTAHLRGGVLYNTGTINIGKNVSFSSNTLDGGGGAISNYEGNINIESNVSFINNSIVKETSHGFSGGAISNQYGTINIGSNAKFIQNFSTEGSGGAISNRLNSTIYIGSDAIFNMNDSGYYSGAVIYNDDTSSCYLGDNIEISSNTGDSIIHSQNILQIGKNVKFLFNEAGNSILTFFGQNCTIEEGAEFYSNKGASVISNNGTLELKEDSNFISNQTSNGTLVNSKNCTIGSNSIFSLNISSGTSPYSGHGGAISNRGTLKVDYNANFSSNTAKGNVEVYGGAIYNTGSLIISSTTKFEFNNSVTSGDYINRGGAIYNNGFCDIGKDVSFISNATIGDNQDGACGGAIYSEGKIQIGENVNFDNNNSTHGGAIFSTSDLNIGKNATFKGNNSSKNGGAIFSTGNTFIEENVTFQDNTCNENGGAIKSFGITTILNGANFIGNISNQLGGAIHNEGVLNLTANTVNIEFNGNMANGVSNAIHDDKGTINLWASDSADIVFNDRITSEDNTSVLNINSPNTTLNAIGKIVLNEDMSGYNGTVNLYDGTIKLGEKGTLFSGDMFVDNATIDMANNVIKENNLKKLTINNNLNIVVDADLQTEEMDTMYIDSFEGDGKVNIRGVNILSDNNKNETTEILFTSSTVLKNKITSVKTVSSKLFKYVLSYNDGYFKFRNVGDSTDSNPIILESSVAGMASGLITQTTVLNQAFSSIDNIRNRITQAKQKGLLYASTADVVFNNSEIESGLWIRPFMAQDTIKLDSLDVDNTLTGTLAGLDLATGENSLVSFYLGYAGSNQKYEDIKVNQTGYIVGATGMLIKDKWYAGITANINFNKAESESDYGTDSFDLNMYSIGAKAGYNFEIGSNWIIEPNLTLMYGNISNQEYETTQGAKIDSQSNSNIIVEPQVKAKLDLTNGWQPYGLLGYVANISDKGKVVADEIEFETDKIDGYVEYGAGINKEFINTPWSCYAQVTGRSGGINGFSGNIGVKYSFGSK